MYVVGDWVEGNVGNLSFGNCWEANKAAGEWDLVIPAAGDIDAGGRVQGYGRVFSE